MPSKLNETDYIDIKKYRHKAELPLIVISLVFSLGVYGLLTYLSIQALNNENSAERLTNMINDEEGIFEPLIKYGAFFVLIAFIVLYIYIVIKFFANLGEAVSRDIPVTDKQFSNLKEYCELYSKRLKLKVTPELYISQEGRARVETSFMAIENERFIRLNCYYTFAACDLEDYASIKFLIASELAHIILGHRDPLWVLLTLPARLIPIYKNVIGRAMNYSADRIAAELVGKEDAINAIITLSNDPYMVCKLDKDKYISDMLDRRSNIHQLSRTYYNLFSDMPIPAYRIAAISNPNNSGKLF